MVCSVALQERPAYHMEGVLGRRDGIVSFSLNGVILIEVSNMLNACLHISNSS